MVWSLDHPVLRSCKFPVSVKTTSIWDSGCRSYSTCLLRTRFPPAFRPPLTTAVLVSKDNNNNYHFADLLLRPSGKYFPFTTPFILHTNPSKWVLLYFFLPMMLLTFYMTCSKRSQSQSKIHSHGSPWTPKTRTKLIYRDQGGRVKREVDGRGVPPLPPCLLLLRQRLQSGDAEQVPCLPPGGGRGQAKLPAGKGLWNGN